jgi:hypothetical protein
MHNADAYQQIKKIETHNQIRQSAIFLKPSLKSDDPEKFEAARHAHKDLVDCFYLETSDYVSRSQYEAAVRDFEYFLRLIDWLWHTLLMGWKQQSRFNSGFLNHNRGSYGNLYGR